MASFSTFCAIVASVGCAKRSTGSTVKETSARPVAAVPVADHQEYSKPAGEDLRSRLTPMQFEVTQRDGTEPPFKNAYWDNKQAGLYVDVVTGEPLFASVHKFDSGTGWPSFTRPVDGDRIVSRSDTKIGMVRTEVRSRGGDSHLGHLFDDGPEPAGDRYCINSAAMRFIPVSQLEKEGYGGYLDLFAKAK